MPERERIASAKARQMAEPSSTATRCVVRSIVGTAKKG